MEGRIEEIRNRITEYEKNTVRTDKFMEVVRKYQDCQEITTPMLNEFIEKIIVHEVDKSGGRLDRKQKVDIYFNFVGQIDLSEPTTQEKITDKLTAGRKKAKVSYTYMWNVCKYSNKRGEIMDDSSSRSMDKVFVYSHNRF